jgi:hypothetical protein
MQFRNRGLETSDTRRVKKINEMSFCVVTYHWVPSWYSVSSKTSAAKSWRESGDVWSV